MSNRRRGLLLERVAGLIDYDVVVDGRGCPVTADVAVAMASSVEHVRLTPAGNAEYW